MVIEKPKNWTTKCYVRQIVPYSVIHSFKPKKRVIYTDSVPISLQRKLDNQSTSKQASEYSYPTNIKSIRRISEKSLNSSTNSNFMPAKNYNETPLNEKLCVYQLQKLHQNEQKIPKFEMESPPLKENPNKNYCSNCTTFHLSKKNLSMCKKRKVLRKKIHKSIGRVLKDSSSQTESTFLPCNLSNPINGIYYPEYIDSLSYLKSLNPKISKAIFQAQHINHNFNSSKSLDSKNTFAKSNSDSTKMLFNNVNQNETSDTINKNEFSTKPQIYLNSVATNTIDNDRFFNELLKTNVFIQTSSILKKDATTSSCKITSSEIYFPKHKNQNHLKMHYVNSNITTSQDYPFKLKNHYKKSTKEFDRRMILKEKSFFSEKAKLLLSLTDALKENHLKLNEYINDLKYQLTELLSFKNTSPMSSSNNILRSHNLTSIDNNKICSNENQCEFFHFLREYANIIANRTKQSENFATNNSQNFEHLSKIESSLSNSNTMINKIEFLVKQLRAIQNRNKNSKLSLKNVKQSCKLNLNSPRRILSSKNRRYVKEIYVNPNIIIQNGSEQELRRVSM